MLLLALAAGVAAYHGSRGLDSQLAAGQNRDVWFEADCPRVFDNAAGRTGVQLRSAVHPLFALFTRPLVSVLRWSCGLEPLVALRALRALTAAACGAAFYGLLRTIGCRRLDSVLFSVLAATSAAAMFWFVVPEIYPAGLLTILLALVLVSRGEKRPLSLGWDVLVNIATLAFTITNWMVGLLATFVRWPARRALLIVFVALCFALALMAVQHEVSPSAAPVPIPLEEQRFILHPDTGGPLRVALAFMFHSMAMPSIATADRYANAVGPVMTVQHSWPGSAGVWSLAAVALWAALLGLGVCGMCRCRRQRRLRIVLSLTLLGQLVLHLLYGAETFLYACHFGPLLVVVAAFAALSPARRIAIALTIGLIVCAGINNAGQLARAATFVEQNANTAGRVGDWRDGG